MLQPKPIFPHVIEMNYQAGQIIGCNVYLIYDAEQWILIDAGYDDTLEEIIELIREMDFPFAHCKGLIATHADVDHAQGLARLKQVLRAPLAAHPGAAAALATGDRLYSFAEIRPHEIDMAMPAVEVDRTIDEGDVIRVGDLKLEVWATPGHTDCQLSFRLGQLLFSADNLYRDGCVGAIDAHHGSDIPAFIRSLQRIRQSDVEWLLPGHGPYFRKQDDLLDRAIERLMQFQHMADFGTCAVDWPLMDEWEQELAKGHRPN